MRYIIGTMIGFYILTFWLLGFIDPFLFPWGDARETHLHPIYLGLVLLSGLIVACTKIVLDEIKTLKKKENYPSEE